MGVIEYIVRNSNQKRNMNRIRCWSRGTPLLYNESSYEQNDLCWRGGIERNTRWNGPAERVMKQTDWHLAGQCFYDHETQSRNLFHGRKWCVPGLWENFIKCLSRSHRRAATRSNPSCIFISSNTRHKDSRPPLITFPTEYFQNEISPPYTDLDIQRMVFSHDFHPQTSSFVRFSFVVRAISPSLRTRHLNQLMTQTTTFQREQSFERKNVTRYRKLLLTCLWNIDDISGLFLPRGISRSWSIVLILLSYREESPPIWGKYIKNTESYA